MELRIKCGPCNGTGENPSPVIRYDGNGNELPTNTVCGVCGGTGYKPEAIELSDVIEKLDSIISEQASQRADLTTALVQIWNKVKDLP